ncbi:MAG: DNA/RNA nuclease SfsA, partial [Pseudomonadota bacterium]
DLLLHADRETTAAYETASTRTKKAAPGIDLDASAGCDAAPPARTGSCFVEVKNVHLLRSPGLAEFPDSVTARGAKHLAELADMVAAGHRAVMVFLIQRADTQRFALAGDIDPAYVEAYRAATAAGVEAIALVCDVSPTQILAARTVPIEA